MLFSRIVELPIFLKTAIARTAIGTDADTVRPARRARYTVAAPKKMPKNAPSRIALSVNSAGLSSGAMYGRNSDPDEPSCAMRPPSKVGGPSIAPGLYGRRCQRLGK